MHVKQKQPEKYPAAIKEVAGQLQIAQMISTQSGLTYLHARNQAKVIHLIQIQKDAQFQGQLNA